MVEVKTEGPKTIGGFVGELKKMLMKLVNAQNRHKKIHAKMMKQCKEEASFRAKEIKAARGALKRATAHRAKCIASRRNAQKALPALIKTLRTYVSEFRRAKKQRAVERRKYIGRKNALRGALKFLQGFIKFIRGHLKKELKAFALADMSETLLKHSAKLNMMEEVVPVLAALASRKKHNDYSFNANQSLGNKLKAALDGLVKRLKADAAKNDAVERAAVAAFKKYSARLTKVIGTLRKTIRRLKRQVVLMTRCIATETKVIKDANSKLARNALLAKQAAKMCKNFNKDFIQATYNRLDEIKTMKVILQIAAKRLADLPKDLIAYLEKVKNGWIKYVNSTVFKKFKEYERKRYAKNKRGALLAKLKAKNDQNPTAAVVKGAKGIY